MASGSENLPKQEEKGVRIREKDCIVQIDLIKEDEVRKELYESERRAREKWSRKWGFLKNPRKLWKEEAAKMALPTDAFDEKRNKFLPRPEECPESYNFSVQRLPVLSSRMIGWRSTTSENNLDRFVGSIYVSRKVTMNPPQKPDETDLNRQSFIILG